MISSSPGTATLARTGRGLSGRIAARWLPLLRGTWLVCALLLLANFVFSIPAYDQILNTVCSSTSQGDCTSNFGQLAPATVEALSSLHLSLGGYALSFVILDVLVSLLPWGIGLLVFWRKSDEVMGLIVSLLLILFAGNGVSNTLSGLWAGGHPTPFVSLLLSSISGAQWIGLGLFLLTFPTGRFAPRWSGCMLLFWIWTFVSPPLPSPLYEFVNSLAAFLTLGGTLFVLVYRYVRVFDAQGRQQTKWVVYAAAAWVIITLGGNALSVLLPAQSPFQVLLPTFNMLLPSICIYLGLGFAILRYRLWDIDTIINRTLVYGSLTAILTLTYVAAILGLQALTQAISGQAGAQPLVTVGSTLLIIALFAPLRRWLQTFIDRRFYRKKYDAEKTLAAFSATLRNEVDLEHFRAHLLAVVQETMQPAHVSLWLRQPERPVEEPPRHMEPGDLAPNEPGLGRA
jgi:hypothetical protein